MDIFKLDGWNVNKFSCKYIDSDLKVLEERATSFHNSIESINSYMSDARYIVHTFIKGSEKKNKYKLSVKIKLHGETGYKHKKNTHGQEIYI
jgi:hypothetical protein